MILCPVRDAIAAGHFLWIVRERGSRCDCVTLGNALGEPIVDLVLEESDATRADADGLRELPGSNQPPHGGDRKGNLRPDRFR
jgi:hypothetical protein